MSNNWDWEYEDFPTTDTVEKWTQSALHGPPPSVTYDIFKAQKTNLYDLFKKAEAAKKAEAEAAKAESTLMFALNQVSALNQAYGAKVKMTQEALKDMGWVPPDPFVPKPPMGEIQSAVETATQLYQKMATAQKKATTSMELLSDKLLPTTHSHVWAEREGACSDQECGCDGAHQILFCSDDCCPGIDNGGEVCFELDLVYDDDPREPSSMETVGAGCCSYCQGSGSVTNGSCWDCQGTGHPHSPHMDCAAQRVKARYPCESIEQLMNGLHAFQIAVSGSPKYVKMHPETAISLSKLFVAYAGYPAKYLSTKTVVSDAIGVPLICDYHLEPGWAHFYGSSTMPSPFMPPPVFNNNWEIYNTSGTATMSNEMKFGPSMNIPSSFVKISNI